MVPLSDRGRAQHAAMHSGSAGGGTAILAAEQRIRSLDHLEEKLRQDLKVSVAARRQGPADAARH